MAILFGDVEQHILLPEFVKHSELPVGSLVLSRPDIRLRPRMTPAMHGITNIKAYDANVDVKNATLGISESSTAGLDATALMIMRRRTNDINIRFSSPHYVVEVLDHQINFANEVARNQKIRDWFEKESKVKTSSKKWFGLVDESIRSIYVVIKAHIISEGEFSKTSSEISETDASVRAPMKETAAAFSSIPPIGFDNPAVNLKESTSKVAGHDTDQGGKSTLKDGEPRVIAIQLAEVMIRRRMFGFGPLRGSADEDGDDQLQGYEEDNDDDDDDDGDDISKDVARSPTNYLDHGRVRLTEKELPEGYSIEVLDGMELCYRVES